MDKPGLKYDVRLQQYRGFNAAALQSEGKYENQITLADSHQLEYKRGSDAFVWETGAEQSRRRRQKEKEYRKETQKNYYKKLNTLNLNY